MEIYQLLINFIILRIIKSTFLYTKTWHTTSLYAWTDEVISQLPVIRIKDFYYRHQKT